MKGAIAVDLGATSARYAAGWLEDGQLQFEVIEQIAHEIVIEKGRQVWQFDRLMQFVRRAAEYGSNRFSQATLGIDAWGVDHGFVDPEGNLIQAPVAYRDNSHEKSFNALRSHRDELYLRTGIQHQPFNTIYQLAARKAEQPELIHQDTRWLLLPDLMGFLVTRQANYELTESSTTQLMGLDNTWSVEAFELAGWPVPDLQPSLPGHVGGYICDRVRLMEVGSHDTASAVFGLGPYSDGQVFLNIGTWSLLGRVVSNPIVNPEAQAANFTNERCVDGKVRFLKNVPGFWVMNRLHDELGISQSIPEWIESANLSVSERLDLESPALFSPDSMLAACAEQLKRQDFEPSVWSGICVNSLADCIAQNVSLLGRITGPLSEIKVGGGASKSDLILAQLAEKTGMKITRSHPEATLVGNLRYQLSVSSKRRS